MNFYYRHIARKPFWTYTFLIVQILIFLAMEITGLIKFGSFGGSESVSILIQYGAMNSQLVFLNHEYWRLLTPIFVHIGLFHLVINSITLYFIGPQIEGIFGHWRFLLIYLLSGSGGNVLSFAFGSHNSVSAGASTSLFGIIAAFIGLAIIFQGNPYIQATARHFTIFIIMNLAINMFSTGIDIYGHLGGAIAGFLVSYCLAVKNPPAGTNIHTRIISGAFYVFLVVCMLYYGHTHFVYSLM